MSDYGDDDMRMTAREWTAARLVVIGGFIIAIAVAGYFTWQQHEQNVQAAAAAQAQAAAEAKAAATPTPQQIARAQARMNLVVCAREVLNAVNTGIVPDYAKLGSAAPAPTNVQGRYTCTAVTNVAKYAVTADLVCSNMKKAECVHLYNIVSADGTVLYQTREN